MDIDFPLVLVTLSFISGVIYLIDFLWLAPMRKQRVANFEVANKTPKQLQDSDHKNPREALAKEPIIVEYAKSLFPVFFLVLLFRSFIAESFTIPSESMLPSLEAGDYIIVNKFAYGFRLPVIGTKIIDMDNPKRGDVMVFKFPDNPKINFIKRVIGVPGDEVRYEKKRLYINGQLIEEILTSTDINLGYSQEQQYQEKLGEANHAVQKYIGAPEYNKETHWKIPEGQYFVMGDNRDNSNDSRFWGTVPDELVMGRAFGIWMHKVPGLHLPTFSRNGMIE